MRSIPCLVVLVGSAFSCLAAAAQPPDAPPRAASSPTPAPVTETTAPLPADVQRHLAALTPIFDGATLNGWIQAPPAPFTLSREDLKDVTALIARLRTADPLSAHLASRFDEPGRTMLAGYVAETADARQTKGTLARSLNAIISDGGLYEASRFEGVKLRGETRALLERKPAGQDLARLNRMLLEDAYPEAIVQSPLTAWIVKDGAMASTGAGRGVIYTEKDYHHYRLVFQVRQITGNHVPGILVFCHRPVPGQKHDSALHAVQFQVPNGGHWDYREGVNKAGAHFTRPTRTKFDLKQWAQVEVLVNAKTGVVRMAVAQPVGTKGIVNLVFNDPAAGRPGPIALQMHNAGLFDEFRDLRVEIDPKEDRLLTAE